jgi:hypothetical protein
MEAVEMSHEAFVVRGSCRELDVDMAVERIIEFGWRCEVDRAVPQRPLEASCVLTAEVAVLVELIGRRIAKFQGVPGVG